MRHSIRRNHGSRTAGMCVPYPSIPGYVDNSQDVIQERLEVIGDEIWRDRVGKVIGLKRATVSPQWGRLLRVVLAAHADEVGMMIKHMDADGLIRCQGVGRLNPQVLVCPRVLIHGRKPTKDVIGPRRSGEPLPALDEMLIDVGLPREQVCEIVEVGDINTFARHADGCLRY